MSLRPSDPSVELWRHLLEYQRTATGLLDRELQTERSMSLEEYDLLYQLSVGEGPLRMTDLASAALIGRSSCTRLVDRLFERGWVERATVATDRRSIKVALTTLGRSALRRSAITHMRGLEKLFTARLNPRDTADLSRILGRLQERDQR